MNPKFDTEKAILELGTGEALVSFQDEKGAPSIVERVTILPPQSQMGAIDGMTRNKIINNSPLCGKYDEAENPESAAEIIEQKAETKAAEEKAREEAALAAKQQAEANKAAAKAADEQAKLAEKERKAAERAASTAKSKQKTLGDRFLGNVVGSLGSTVGRKITNKILKDLFK